MLFNIVGFIPLGAVLYGFLQSYSRPFNSHKKFIAVTLCMILSLGIELGQAWIPARTSSLMDLILNTFGAWLGVGLWNLIRNSSM
jgi:glycopeptide antibiotics resistance protein